MYRNITPKFQCFIDIPVCIQHSHVIKTNPSKFDERLYSEIHLWRLHLKQGLLALQITRNTGFYIFRQGVPEGCSSKGYASFKQAEPCSWQIEVIPGVSLVGLVDKLTYRLSRICSLASEDIKQKERKEKEKGDWWLIKGCAKLFGELLLRTLYINSSLL